MKRRKKSKILWGLLFIVFSAIAGSLSVAGVFYVASKNLPSVKSLREYTPNIVTRVYSDDDRLIGEFYIEKRVVVPLRAMPVYLRHAVVAVEDDRFYRPKGIDYKGILRAFWVNLIHMDIKQGGRTITQKLARSLFLSPDQNIMRKIREAILSRRIEQVLSVLRLSIPPMRTRIRRS